MFPILTKARYCPTLKDARLQVPPNFQGNWDYACVGYSMQWQSDSEQWLLLILTRRNDAPHDTHSIAAYGADVRELWCYLIAHVFPFMQDDGTRVEFPDRPSAFLYVPGSPGIHPILPYYVCPLYVILIVLCVAYLYTIGVRNARIWQI